MSTPDPSTPSAAAQEKLQGLILQVRIPLIQERTWERHLTDAERQFVERHGLSEKTIDTIWAAVKGVSPARAVLDIAVASDLLSIADFQWLCREIGESDAIERPRPKWDGQRGCLLWGEQLIRTVKPMAKNVTKILAAFEEDGWPPRIDDPLPGDQRAPDQRLRETVATLNEGLKVIRFRTDGTGEGVIWEFVD